MGKYSGRVLTVYITQSGVRVCEGENRNGNPDITKFFTVAGVSEYFTTPTAGQVAEIINMSGLVSAIVGECKNRHTSSKRVMVCSDCFGIHTEIREDDAVGGLKTLLTGDLKKSKEGKQSKERVSTTPDKMVCKQSWGELTFDGAVQKISTVSTGDKYMLKSLVQEFYTHGYEVIYVCGSQEVLMNFRQTELASFDSQGKVIFDYGVSCAVTVFVKDVPVAVDQLVMLESQDDLLARLKSQLNTALVRTGRNPRIYLAGSVFQDTAFYGRVMDELESEGYTVYDLFNRPAVGEDYARLLQLGEIEPVMTPDYSANIAMFMCAFSKVLISLTPTVELADMFRKNAQVVATLVLAGSIGMFVISGVLAGFRVYNMVQMKRDPSNVASLQSQVQSLTSRQQSLNGTIQTLTQADTTILELMKFIDINQSDRVSVVSVDTRDMLSDELAVDTSGVAVVSTPAPTPAQDVAGGGAGGPPDVAITGTAGGAATTRESIVIRGYAKSGNEAVAYYDRLFKYGLPSDPILNGVERYVLPDGDEVYVFEIEIGGDNFE